MPVKPPPQTPSDAGSGDASPRGSAKPCPICGKPAAEASQPFCSSRCRDVDLNRWFSNSYMIPATSDDDEETE